MSRKDTQATFPCPILRNPCFLVTSAPMPSMAGSADPQRICELTKPSIGSFPDPSSLPEALFPVTGKHRTGCWASNVVGPLALHCGMLGTAALTLLEDPVHVEPVSCAGLIVAAPFHFCAQGPSSSIAHHSRRGSTDPVCGDRKGAGLTRCPSSRAHDSLYHVFGAQARHPEVRVWENICPQVDC